MNTNCPKCGTNYGVTAAHVGRKFKCKSCGSALVVTEDGLDYQPSAAPAVNPHVYAEETTAVATDDRDERDDEVEARPSRGRARTPRRGGGIGDYLTFRKMIVPLVIQIIFWLGVALTVFGGLYALVNAPKNMPAQFYLITLGMIVLGPFLMRMYCELLIVMFRINDTLTDIKNELSRRP